MDQTSLAIERVEQAALADLHMAASAETRETLGLGLEAMGTVLVSIAAREPSILLNRTIGLGIVDVGNRETVFDVVACYRDAGVGRFFFHLHPEARPAALRDWMGEAGLTPARGWMKFRRGATAPSELVSELEVREIGPEHATDFGRIVASGFDLSAQAVPLLAAVVGRPDWRIFMTFAATSRPAPARSTSRTVSAGWTGAPPIPPSGGEAVRARYSPGAFGKPSRRAVICWRRRRARQCPAIRSTPTTTSSRQASRRTRCARTWHR